MKKFLQSLVVFVLGSILTEGFFRGLNNKARGRTFLGKKKTPKKTYEDWDGNIHMSPEDGKVA